MPDTPSDPRPAPPPTQAGAPQAQLAGALARLGTLLAAHGHGPGTEVGLLLAEVASRVEVLAVHDHELAARLEETALTDGLTGLPNRRYALQRLTAAWAAAVRHGRELACLVVNADELGRVNQELGQEAGALVLVRLARTLRAAMRESDEVCRLDGDQFLVLCPETSLEGALTAGERLRTAAAALRIDVPGGAWKGSVSVGAAAAQQWMAASEELFQTAAAGLDEARRGGGNAVAVAPAVGVARRARRPPGA